MEHATCNYLEHADNSTPDTSKFLKVPLFQIEEYKLEICKLRKQLDIKKKLADDTGETLEFVEHELDHEKKLRSDEANLFKSQKHQLDCMIFDLQQKLEDQRVALKDQEHKLKECLVNTERNKEMVSQNQNESLLIEYESKIDELKSKNKNLGIKCQEYSDNQLQMLERIKHLESNIKDRDVQLEKLNGYVTHFQTELSESKKQISDMKRQIHEVNSNSADVAPQGNSLFSEVSDGKKQLEAEMQKVYKEKEALRLKYSRALKHLNENYLHSSSAVSEELLTGPTLAVIKTMKNDLSTILQEKRVMQDRLLKLENEKWERSIKQEGISVNLYRELVCEEHLMEKQRAEQRVLELEFRFKDFAECLSYEAERAKQVGSLENRISALNQLVSHYEKNLLKELD